MLPWCCCNVMLCKVCFAFHFVQFFYHKLKQLWHLPFYLEENPIFCTNHHQKPEWRKTMQGFPVGTCWSSCFHYIFEIGMVQFRSKVSAIIYEPIWSLIGSVSGTVGTNRYHKYTPQNMLTSYDSIWVTDITRSGSRKNTVSRIQYNSGKWSWNVQFGSKMNNWVFWRLLLGPISIGLFR